MTKELANQISYLAGSIQSRLEDVHHLRKAALRGGSAPCRSRPVRWARKEAVAQGVICDQERSSLKGETMTGWRCHLSPDSGAVGIGEG